MVVARVPESSTPAQAYDACAEHGSLRSAPSTPSASGRERARKGPDRGWRDWSARRALQLAAVELADRCRRSAATSSDAARAAASSAGPALPGGPAPADAECEARDGPAPAYADPRLPGRPRRSHHGARVARRRRRSAQRAMRSMSRSWRRTRYSQGYSLRTPRSGAAAAPDAAAAAPRRSPPRGIAAQALDA